MAILEEVAVSDAFWSSQGYSSTRLKGYLSGDEDALFTQLVAGSVLTMCRERNGVINHGVFSRIISPIFEIGSTPAAVNECINAAVIDQFAITVKGIALYTHDCTGFRHIAEFFSQIEQTCFVFDEVIGSMTHDSYLLFCIRILHLIKTGNSQSFNA